MRNSTRVTVDGKSFMLRGEATVEHIQQVAEYVDIKMAEVRKEAAAVRFDPTMIYVLTALNITDDYINAEKKVLELENEIIGLEDEVKELQKIIEDLKSEKLKQKLQKKQSNGVDLNIVSEVEILSVEEDSNQIQNDADVDVYTDEYFDEGVYDEQDELDDEEYAFDDEQDVESYIEELEELEEIEIPRIFKEQSNRVEQRATQPVHQESRRNTRSSRGRRKR